VEKPKGMERPGFGIERKELTDEQKAELIKDINENLAKNLSDGNITQEQYDEAIAAIQDGKIPFGIKMFGQNKRGAGVPAGADRQGGGANRQGDETDRQNKQNYGMNRQSNGIDTQGNGIGTQGNGIDTQGIGMGKININAGNQSRSI
jgi:hypothetical protein